MREILGEARTLDERAKSSSFLIAHANVPSYAKEIAVTSKD
jgi:hypothetical protein